MSFFSITTTNHKFSTPKITNYYLNLPIKYNLFFKKIKTKKNLLQIFISQNNLLIKYFP